MSKRVVVAVNVTFDSSGVPNYRYILASGGSGKAETVKLKSGDQLAWVVTVFNGGLVQTPPYQLTFSNPSVLGTGSLNVPSGGYSPFLQAVTPSTWPSGVMKYSLSVSGINPPSDPLIQVDDETLIQATDAPTHYQIRWQPGQNKMQYSTDGINFQDFTNPLTVKPNDGVTFLVDPADEFCVVFPVQFPAHPIPPFNPFNASSTNLPGRTLKDGKEFTDEYTVRTVAAPENPNFTFSVAPNSSPPSGNFVIAVKQ